jgi:hypothetical protein
MEAPMTHRASQMTDRPTQGSNLHDVGLLLRAHSEQVWLTTYVVPVLVDLERPESIPSEQLGAALAYLEVLWIDARQRATETERAFAALLASEPEPELLRLRADARRHHAAVCSLRDTIARHVEQLTAANATLAGERAPR